MMKIRISELDLSTRLCHCLMAHAGLEFLEEVSAWSEAELMGLPNFGKQSLKEIRDVARVHGINLVKWKPNDDALFSKVSNKDEWQPIETAPDEGEFLAYDSAAKKQDVCYKQDNGCVRQVQMDGEYGPLEDEFGYRTEHITHWRPLFVPPV